MAKIFSRQGTQMFGDAFLSTHLQNQRLQQQESEFQRSMNFSERQLRLGEAFRRDELAETVNYHNILNEYYQEQIRQGDVNARLRQAEGEERLLREGWKRYDETMSPAPTDIKLEQMYDGSWIAPPVKEAELIPYGDTVIERNFFNEPITGRKVITGYENQYGETKWKPEDGSNDLPDISTEAGDLQKLIEFYDLNEKNIKNAGDWKGLYTDTQGNEMEMDYKLLKSTMTEHMTDMMSKAGDPLQGDIVHYIRSYTDMSGDNKTKRKNMLETIDAARYYGIPINGAGQVTTPERAVGFKKLNDKQYEALRYWAEAGTR